MKTYKCRRCGLEVSYDELTLSPPKDLLCEDCYEDYLDNKEEVK
jgi:rubredoxin